MGKKPYIKTNMPYEIALFNKNRWIYLHGGIGTTTGNTLEIPNLKIENIEKIPIAIIYEDNFGFHEMVTVMQMQEEITVVEYKKLTLKEAIIIYRKLKINVYNCLLTYKGKYIDEFKYFCKYILKKDQNQQKSISLLFSRLEPCNTDTYKSLAYETWYKAKRENQTEWPLISKYPKENSIELDGVWYWYPERYVRLIKRRDDNIQPLIPKVFKTKTEKTQKYPGQ